MSRVIVGEVLEPGAAEGRVFRLAAPISFWGGIDPLSGRVADPRHPDFGSETAGRILAVPATVGSSSSSAIMLELLRNGTAPAALLLLEADAILLLGIVVARELGYPTIPALKLRLRDLQLLPSGSEIALAEGRISVGTAP